MSFACIAVIYNPNSGRVRRRRKQVERFAQLLRKAGRTVIIYRTEQPHQATEFAVDAINRGCDLVVAHGGDGTMNEVLQSLVGTEATLCFWPGGTANVLATEIRFPKRPAAVVERILQGRVERVNVGRANSRYFLLMAGIGLDAEVAAAVDPGWKRRIGMGAFALSTLQFLWRWNLQAVRVQLPDEELVGRFVVVGNARSYGGGFRLTPKAELSDPHLDLCVFSSQRRFDYIRYAIAAAFGAHLKMDGVTYRKVKGARIQAAEGVGPMVQLDGEVAGAVPLELSVVPEGVKLLV